MAIESILFFITLGSVIGFLSSFLGIGGGVFIVPLLPMLYPVSAIETIMISTLCVGSISCINSFYFAKQKIIDYPLVLYITVPILISGYITIKFAVRMEDIYFRLLLLIVLFVALLNPFKYFIVKRNWFVAGALGSLIGPIGATTGVGMTILSPILYQSGWSESKRIAPSANASMIFSSIFMFSFYYLEIPTPFDWSKATPVVLYFVPFALMTSFIGRKLNMKKLPIRKYLLKSLLVLLIIKVSYELYPVYM